MKTSILVLAIALGIFVAVRRTVDTNRDAAAVRGIKVEHGELRKKISREQQRLKELKEASAVTAMTAAQATHERPAPVASSMAADATVKRTANVPTVSATTLIANDPKLMARYLLESRNQIPNSGKLGIFKTVGLSTEQIQAMKDLTVEKEKRQMDLASAVETQGLDQQSDTYKTLNAENEEWLRKTQAEILGDLAPAYREYEGTQDVRYYTTVLAQAALYTGEPVTTLQLERVTQILAANSERIQTGSKIGFVKADTVNWIVATGQLQGLLTPSQIETLQTCYEANIEVSKLENEIARRQALLTAQFKQQSGAK